uniref:Transmembrane protein n=1 Tax=Heterorhabditis bacteriophora TaxID=37862 RepID=A0A1I7WNR3_HETBA
MGSHYSNPPPTDWRQSVWSLGSPSATEVKIAGQVTPVHKRWWVRTTIRSTLAVLYTFHVPYLTLVYARKRHEDTVHSSQHGWHRHLSDDELLKQSST